MARKRRIFISYDIDNDLELFNFIKEQSKKADSPFDLVDKSTKWIPPEIEWRENLKKRLAFIEVLIIMLGEKTFRSHNVNEEVDIAYSIGKPMLQINGKKFAKYRSIPKAGKVHEWNWEGLKNFLKVN